MTLTLKAYSDLALSSQMTKLSTLQRSDGSTGPVDHLIYLGSTVPGKQFRAASNPGTDQITLSITDGSPGSGQPATAVRLALTAEGLDEAVPGTPLPIGTVISSGADHAVEVHIRIEAQNLDVGTYDDLSLMTNPLVESYA